MPLKGLPGPGISAPACPCNAAVRIDLGSLGSTPCCGILVEGLMETLVISPVKTESNSQIKSQLFAGMKVILEVGLQDFIAVVILGLGTCLGEVGDVAC